MRRPHSYGGLKYKNGKNCASQISIGRLLIAIPLFLALFALILQFSSTFSSSDGIFNDPLYISGVYRYINHQFTHFLVQHTQLSILTAPPPPTLSLSLSLCSDKDLERQSRRLPRLETEIKNRNSGSKWSTGFRSSFHHSKTDIPSLNGEQWDTPINTPPKPLNIAFTVTTSESVPQIKVWLAYHRFIGVSKFYLFVDGSAAQPAAVAELRAQQGVKVVEKDDFLVQRHKNSRIWNETWLSAFFDKPCNNELFVTQSLNMEYSIQMAKEDKIDWLLHIDTDELIYPGGSHEYAIQEVLSKVPVEVDLLVFPNYESLPERDDISYPFVEVSLFKRNFNHVVSEHYFKNYATVAKGNPNYFITYGNGKSAARVQEGLRPNGAHRWHNYNKKPVEWSSDQAAVLHYTYNKFSDLKSRRDRCDCAPTEEDAQRCFILPFDRMAFLEASLKSEEELLKWYRERLVWDNPDVVNNLLQNGLFVRLYEPQLLMRGFVAAEELKNSNKNKSSINGNGGDGGGEINSPGGEVNNSSSSSSKTMEVKGNSGNRSSDKEARWGTDEAKAVASKAVGIASQQLEAMQEQGGDDELSRQQQQQTMEGSLAQQQLDMLNKLNSQH